MKRKKYRDNMKKELQEKFTKEYKTELMKKFADPIAKIGAKTDDPEIYSLLQESIVALMQYISLIDEEVIELYKDSLKYYEYKAIQTATDAVDKMKADQFVSEMTSKEEIT